MDFAKVQNTFKIIHERLIQVLLYIQKVVETKDVNKEEEEGQAILMTNVLELTLANKQQPKEPIRIVVPVHSDEIASEGDMVVLASLVEQPEEESDWEVKDATRNPDGKTAFFYVDHFSL